LTEQEAEATLEFIASRSQSFGDWLDSRPEDDEPLSPEEHATSRRWSTVKIGGTTYTYDNADELEKAGEITYTYNKMGERTKTTPKVGAEVVTYEYNQAGVLTGVKRETPEIKDTYTYDGNNLRVSQTINGTKHSSPGTRPKTSAHSQRWDLQLHLWAGRPAFRADQQLRNATLPTPRPTWFNASNHRYDGSKEGAYTYDAYGNAEHTGSATTHLDTTASTPHRHRTHIPQGARVRPPDSTVPQRGPGTRGYG
jgi:hypothetical protein